MNSTERYNNKQNFHIACFVCSRCGCNLKGKDIITISSNLFCSDCGNLPICNYCKNEITDDYILANDLHFHKDHFFCSACKQVIPNGEYYMANDMIVCEYCQNEKECKEEPESQAKEKFTLKELQSNGLPSYVDLSKKEVFG